MASRGHVGRKARPRGRFYLLRVGEAQTYISRAGHERDPDSTRLRRCGLASLGRPTHRRVRSTRCQTGGYFFRLGQIYRRISST